MLDKLKYIPYEQFDISKCPLAEQVKAFAESTDHVRFLAKDVINPVLEGQLQPNDREKAILGCYYRAYAWIATIAMLKEPIHFQAVAAGARTLFELSVDLKLIIIDSSGNYVEKFHIFTEVERFRSAKRLVEFSNRNPSLNISCDPQRELVNDSIQIQQIEKSVERQWGRSKNGALNFPNHWTGKDLFNRIPSDDKHLQRIYKENYARLSWHVHSGSTGYAGLSDDNIRQCFVISHIMAQRLFLDIAEIAAEEMKITQALEWLKGTFEKVKLAPGILLLQNYFQVE